MSHQQQASQRPPILEGNLFEANAEAVLTAVLADYETRQIRGSDNNTIGLMLDIRFGAASEVIVRPQLSNDGGVTWYTRSTFRTFDAADRKEQVPDELTYKAAKWSAEAEVGVVHVVTPPLLIPEGHVVRFLAGAVGPDAGTTLRVRSIGGRGL